VRQRTTIALGDADAFIHPIADKGSSRKLGFRCMEFSEKMCQMAL
jgi:hypothetical protein